MRRVIGSYLSERSNLYRGSISEVYAGVPQGSVMGPTFWNVAYDGVLRLNLLPETTAVAYADDLAVIETDTQILQMKINDSLAEISHWMRRRGLRMAPEKSHAIFLNGRKRPPLLSVSLDGQEVPFTSLLGQVSGHDH